VLDEAFDQGKSPRTDCIERSGKRDLKLKYLRFSHAKITWVIRRGRNSRGFGEEHKNQYQLCEMKNGRKRRQLPDS
jgi:hypothetical protein